ncbi:ACN9 protein -like protein_ mitochondrial [Caligus rogercresseyi]|uniref:Succinate dehydrogenase assembly factor 3 n=1 Tax=Caligus rogercresseyi TaxID=217165 RepID=C1BQS9_CALRO|nr:ACN9 protein homolog, mitochondrial precursor [Caligus rogercresseyi]QQP53026.1 ACN9 protein -like protein_ mitochondrial [Caligus rogercresseyi]
MSGPKIEHVRKVRMLYKTILRLHRGFPNAAMKELGDGYAKDEFRRHKEADPTQTRIFMDEWTTYAINLSKQLGIKGPKTAKPVGSKMSELHVDSLSEEQIVQLYELYQETIKKPSEAN